MKPLCLATLLLMITATSGAQQPRSWQEMLGEWYEIDDAEEDAELQFETLSELAEHRINLNNASREDLEQLPFLTRRQVEDIQEYLYRYGPMRSLAELAMIESIDYRQRQLLECFTFVGENDEKPSAPTLKDILKYGKNELTFTTRVPLYNRKGDENDYLGYPYRHWFRYGFRYGKFVKVGVVGAQDAGEPWLANRNKTGYDYYSCYLLVREMGALKALAVGRYRLHMGMGLVVNNDLTLGKTATLQSLGRQTGTIRAHSSRSEASYLQGIAATVALRRGLELTAFLSHRDIDATLNDDEEGSMATILKTGYHRTASEMGRKHNASQSVEGTRLQYAAKGFHVGTTAYRTSFSRPLRPDTRQTYRQIYPAGSRFWNIGADYGYTGHRFSFAGETATGSCHAWATLNTASLTVTNSLSVVALQRFYSYRYYSLFARSFSDAASVQNESGVYLGAQWQTSRHVSLAAYSDLAYHPWPRYMANDASYSSDHLVMATYSRGTFGLHARYRLRLRERDNQAKTALTTREEHRARLAADYQGLRWQAKTQADMAYTEQEKASFGWMVTQNIACLVGQTSIGATAGYFHTRDYDSRVYTYERGTLYALNFPMFYGHGFRAALQVHAQLTENVHFIGKIANTHYFDRNQIGTGLQQIDGRNQADIDLQVRWNF
ncbi:MAG: helix-hairpin-helix domain-containing protein [Prevotella sp.]|nr:helix-hairpin-helix domain-containing protein [Prevotella sp.]